MKQPKKLTYAQKKELSALGVGTEGYAFCSETDEMYVLWDKKNKGTIEIEKTKRRK